MGHRRCTRCHHPSCPGHPLLRLSQPGIRPPSLCNKTTLSYFFKILIYLALVCLMILLSAMPVNAANMLDCLLAPPLLLVLFCLNYYIVICGHLQFLVFRATNIILLSWMITLIMFGRFLSVLNQKCTTYFLIFINTSKLTFVCPFALYNVTTEKNLTT
jgi:hypothetical protein